VVSPKLLCSFVHGQQGLVGRPCRPAPFAPHPECFLHTTSPLAIVVKFDGIGDEAKEKKEPELWVMMVLLFLVLFV
jgi:hypothetical protein